MKEAITSSISIWDNPTLSLICYRCFNFFIMSLNFSMSLTISLCSFHPRLPSIFFFWRYLTRSPFAIYLWSYTLLSVWVLLALRLFVYPTGCTSCFTKQYNALAPKSISSSVSYWLRNNKSFPFFSSDKSRSPFGIHVVSFTVKSSLKLMQSPEHI